MGAADFKYEGMRGLILFCEYTVLEEYRAPYLTWVRSEPDRWRGVELAENREQRGVFVELRRARDEAEAAALKKERLSGRSGWQQIEGWVKKGREGIRLWTFEPVALSDAAGATGATDATDVTDAADTTDTAEPADD